MRGSGEGDFVEGESGEVGEEGGEAVDGEAVGGFSGAGLVGCGFGDAGGFDGGGAGGAGGGSVVVLEEEGGEPLSQVPLEVVGEHAEEDVGADVVGGMDEDGADLEGALDGAEGALDAGEALVCLDGGVGPEGVGVEAGADDIDAVELGFGGDAVLAAGPGEPVVGDVDAEVLFDLLAVGVAGRRAG